VHVLVIGGTRSLGYLFTWRLLAAGHRVTLLNRGTREDPFGGRVERLRADRTSSDFARLLWGRSFDAAVDFAAFTGPDVASVVDVLGGRVGHYVFISTGQVYLVLQQRHSPAREADYDGPVMPAPEDPRDREEWDYGMGKRACEDRLAEAWATSRFPATRIRIPMVNGERDYHRRIESYLWRILDGGPVLLPDGGARPMRHVYAGSVARALVALLGNPATFGQAYNFSQDETPTLAELVAMLAERLGAATRTAAVPAEAIRAAGLSVKAVSPFSVDWMSSLDPSRAREELAFRHEPLETYLDKIVTAFLAHPPADPPEGYKSRPRELALASAVPSPPWGEGQG
jgi:nucleoside-diphosphate-sugar epimerase